MRAVIAEDSVLLREGVERVLDDAGLEVVGSCDDRRRPPAEGAQLRAGRRDRRHPAAADAQRRGPAGGARDPRRASDGGRARALAVRRARAGDEAARRLRRRRRATCSRTGSAMSRSSSAPSGAWPTAARRSTRSSSRRCSSKRRSDDPLVELTPREREVLELMAEGRSNQGIADKLVITVRAVEKYVSSIFGKLGLPSSGSESRRVLAVLRLSAVLSAGVEDTRNPPPETASLPSSAHESSPATVAESPHGREERAMKTRVIQEEPNGPATPEHQADPEPPRRTPNLAARMAPLERATSEEGDLRLARVSWSCCSRSA